MMRTVIRTDEGDAGFLANPDGYLLHGESVLADAARHAVEHARKLGAREATAMVREAGGYTIKVSGGEIESATRDGSQSLTITAYENGRTGRSTTQALGREAIERAATQALAIARSVEPDDAAGLADETLLARDTPDVPLFAPSLLDATQLADAASAAEAAALDHGSGLRVLDAGSTGHDQRWALATSQDFCRSGSASLHARWVVVLGEKDGSMVRDMWSSRDRLLDRMMPPEAIGAAAATRTLAKLGARGLGTCRAPVLVDSRIAGTLVADLCNALGGMAQVRQATFLPDPIGRSAMAPQLDLTEAPSIPYGLASMTHDSEGVAPSYRRIVEGGAVTSLFLDTLSARKLGMASTGNADGVCNLRLTSRDTREGDDLTAMLRRLGTGLWLTEFLGGSVNPVSGAYSKAASGFWIENGEITGPVNNFTVASTLPAILSGIAAVGADVHREGAISTGSILIDDMQIAGR